MPEPDAGIVIPGIAGRWWPPSNLDRKETPSMSKAGIYRVLFTLTMIAALLTGGVTSANWRTLL